MGTGDVVYADLSGGSGKVSFPSSGTFEVLLQSQATGSSTNTFTLTSISASGKSLGLGNVESDLTLDPPPLSSQDLLDSTLRDQESAAANETWGQGMSKSLSSVKSVSKGVDPGVSPAVSVGDTANLYVLDSLTDTSKCVTITATVKYVSSEVAIYIDNEILSGNPADLPQSDIDSLGAVYTSQLPDERSWFGTYSDIDKNGVAIALISSQVNKLGSSGGGIVTGFFNSDDLSGSGSCSNSKEIVYLVSPDSGGLYGTKISNSFYMSNFAPAVFPHEMQHLINHYQGVILKGRSAETGCLNEGLSHLAEDLVGYGRENYSRYNLFLTSPQSYSACSSTSLAGRGAIYLFLRYLYERSGSSKTFLKSMVQSTTTGYDNIVAAYPDKSSDFDSMGEFLRQWAVALGYSDRITTGTKFKYNARVKNSTTGNWEGACMTCKSEDGRGTTLTGPSYGTYSAGTSYRVKDGATRFLKINGNPSSLDFSGTAAAKGHTIILRTQ